jgi:hypothetical protein
VVLIELAEYLGRYAIVVPVQPFADVAVEGNKMRGAEYEVIFADVNAIGFSHGWRPR